MVIKPISKLPGFQLFEHVAKSSDMTIRHIHVYIVKGKMATSQLLTSWKNRIQTLSNDRPLYTQQSKNLVFLTKHLPPAFTAIFTISLYDVNFIYTFSSQLNYKIFYWCRFGGNFQNFRLHSVARVKHTTAYIQTADI